MIPYLTLNPNTGVDIAREIRISIKIMIKIKSERNDVWAWKRLS